MVLERLEALPVGSFHYKLLLVTGLGWLFDSMDTGLIAFILPVLAKECPERDITTLSAHNLYDAAATMGYR